MGEIEAILKSMLSWSDRLGSDEISEIKAVIARIQYISQEARKLL